MLLYIRDILVCYLIFNSKSLHFFFFLSDLASFCIVYIKKKKLRKTWRVYTEKKTKN